MIEPKNNKTIAEITNGLLTGLELMYAKNYSVATLINWPGDLFLASGNSEIPPFKL